MAVDKRRVGGFSWLRSSAKLLGAPSLGVAERQHGDATCFGVGADWGAAWVEADVWTARKLARTACRPGCGRTPVC